MVQSRAAGCRVVKLGYSDTKGVSTKFRGIFFTIFGEEAYLCLILLLNVPNHSIRTLETVIYTWSVQLQIGKQGNKPFPNIVSCEISLAPLAQTQPRQPRVCYQLIRFIGRIKQ